MTNRLTESQRNNPNISDGSELIPAEVAARQEREEKVELTSGYTASEQGLVNNYAVTPKMKKASYPSKEEQLNYLFQGLIAMAFIAILIGIAFGIS